MNSLSHYEICEPYLKNLLNEPRFVTNAIKNKISPGRRVYEFNAEGRRITMYWIRGGRQSMPERPRAAFAISENEVYLIGVSLSENNFIDPFVLSLLKCSLFEVGLG